MFAIIITEKGGTERREVFGKTEINVGRVQGNDLVLSKGNVSKHHARLVFRDGRCIVADMKSTNGTYVNGRKITQGTIVKEGDKIYIGDFVLRVEANVEAPSQPDNAGSPSGPPSVPAPRDSPSGSGREAIVSHYPLENDPDDFSSGGFSLPGLQARESSRSPAGGVRQETLRGPVPRTSALHATTPVDIVGPEGPGTGGGPPPLPPQKIAPPIARPIAVARPAAPPSPGPAESVKIPPQRLAVFTLVNVVEETLDLSPIESGLPPEEPLASKLEQALRDEGPKLRAAAEIPLDVDLEALTDDARRELLGSGPLEPLLKDEDVIEIHIPSYTSVVSLRASTGRRAEIPFASVASCKRTLRRLCSQTGSTPSLDEHVIDRWIPEHGVHLLAVFDPIARNGVTATLRKRPITTRSLEDLVRSGVLSRSMATFLTHLVTHRRNILIAGPAGSGLTSLVMAIGTAGSAGDRILAVHDGGVDVPSSPNTASLIVSSPDQAEQVMRAAWRLRPDRLLVPHCSARLAAELIDAIVAGTQGIVAAIHAPSVRHALARLAPDVVAARPDLPIEAVREWISSSFDALIEYGEMRDGRSRILRVFEVSGIEHGQIGLRDIYAFSVERVAVGGMIEGSFHATGVVPKVVDELAARGIVIEPTLFRR